LIPRPYQEWAALHRLEASDQNFTAKTKIFSVHVGAEVSEGDLERHLFRLSKAGKDSPLGTGPLAWVAISPDEEFIFFEPLKAVETKTWRESDYSKMLPAEGYFKPLRYSSLKKKLIVATFDCAMDCKVTDKFKIWEIPVP
jgi:hypothetical protein